MTTTRSYRLNALARSIELLESATRAEWNRIARDVAYRERTDVGIAPIAPDALMRLFWSSELTDRQLAWGLVAAMTREQRINQAIEVACWLEGQDRNVAWGGILEKWEAHLKGEGHDVVSEG